MAGRRGTVPVDADVIGDLSFRFAEVGEAAEYLVETELASQLRFGPIAAVCPPEAAPGQLFGCVGTLDDGTEIAVEVTVDEAGDVNGTTINVVGLPDESDAFLSEVALQFPELGTLEGHTIDCGDTGLVIVSDQQHPCLVTPSGGGVFVANFVTPVRSSN